LTLEVAYALNIPQDDVKNEINTLFEDVLKPKTPEWCPLEPLFFGPPGLALDTTSKWDMEPLGKPLIQPRHFSSQTTSKALYALKQKTVFATCRVWRPSRLCCI